MKIGSIPFARTESGALQFYLVSTTNNAKRFAFPKGQLGKGKRKGGGGEDWHAGALRELHEEAGLEGRIVLPHMPIAIPNKKRPKDGVLYYWCAVTAVHEKWPEDTKRHRIVRTGAELREVKLNNTSKKLLKVFRELGFDPAAKNPGKGGDKNPGDWLMAQLLAETAD